jgi:hypothetical protein
MIVFHTEVHDDEGPTRFHGERPTIGQLEGLEYPSTIFLFHDLRDDAFNIGPARDGLTTAFGAGFP